MKKITLILLGFSLLLFNKSNSQTFSTGLVTFTTSPETYSAQIDVTSNLVTLTLIGPANRWLGIGFGTDNMIAGEDVVIFDGTTLTDRHFGFPGQTAGEVAQGIEPTIDSREDWSVVSNDVVGNVRTLVATRLPDTENIHDYVFSAAASSIQLVWAYSRFEDFVLQWHGGNRGTTLESFTLSANSFQTKDFSISPNPAKNRLNINLPNNMANASVAIYDLLGKKVYSGEISSLSSSINVSSWNSGVYLVKVTSNDVTQTKRFIKQ